MVVFRTGVFVNDQTLIIELHTLSQNRLAWKIVDEGIDVVSALKKLFCQKKRAETSSALVQQGGMKADQINAFMTPI